MSRLKAIDYYSPLPSPMENSEEITTTVAMRMAITRLWLPAVHTVYCTIQEPWSLGASIY
jgi:hypothetical protein